MQSSVETLESRVQRLDVTGIDYDSFRDVPLDAATLRCLRAMHDVEFHTVCYLRDLLVTPAHRDPEVTTFLTFWAFEEYWHGTAIARILAVHDEQAGPVRIATLRRARPFADRFRPLLMQGASVLGDDIVAMEMTWGALNERTTQAGYARLAERSGHPVLRDLLERVMRQEGRHVAFYTQQAQTRLAASRRAQVVTRWALDHFWRPVGSGVLPASEVDFLIDHLFGDEDGGKYLARIDRAVDRLPGMARLKLMSRLRSPESPRPTRANGGV